jgi:hypothetical protein
LSYGVDLTVGVNVRDHFVGSFVNTTSDPSTVDAVFGNPNAGHSHLDMQVISLPPEFASATLEEIVFEPLGGNPGGRAFLVAGTVATPGAAPGETVPDGAGTFSLLGMAIGCFALIRRDTQTEEALM